MSRGERTPVMLYTALSSLLERRDDVSRDAGAVQPVRQT